MADSKTTNGTAIADKPSEGTGLEKAGSRTDIITTPTQFELALAKWTGHYNLLSPFTQITGLAPQHGIIASVVKVNPDPSKGGPGEVYDGLLFLGAGEVAIAKIGLRKIAEGAGISLTTLRTDPRTIQFLWEFKAIATYRGIDGTVVTREATAEWDLRDGSPRLKGWTANQVSEGRKNGLRNAETRAINAAIREFGIKQKYHRDELKKPFLVLRVAWQPNPNDPNQMRMVAENAMRGTSTLYGGAPALPAHGEVVEGDVVDGEPRHVGSGAAAPAAKEPDPDQPPVEGAVRIVDVRSKTGETRGKKWTRYLITDSQGVEHSTFSETFANQAAEFKVSQAWVEIHVQEDGDYKNLTGIAPAGQQPKLPDMSNT